MPVYKVTSPTTGKEYKINGPEGASQQEVMGQLMKMSPEFAQDFSKGITNRVMNPTPGDILTGKGGMSAAVTPDQQANIKNSSVLSRVMGNVGAGANRVVTGAGEVLSGNPESPLEQATRQNREKAMAQSIPGGGAMQTAGSAAMTAPLALATGGGGLLSALPSLAIQGAATGALEPAQTAGERLKNMGVGAAVAPVAGTALSIGGKMISKGAQLFSKGAATNAAADTVNKALGADAPAVAAQLRAAPAKTSVGTAPSAGQATNNPVLQGMEYTSRTENPQGWYAHDVANNSARNQTFQNIVGDPVAELTRATDARKRVTQQFQNAATNEIDKQSGNMTRGLSQDISSALSGIKALPDNVDGQKVLDDIANQVARGKPNVTGGQAAEMRANLNNATQADPNIKAAKDAIDGVLAARSSVPGQQNLWDTYLEKFQDASQPVNEAKALIGIKGSHVDPNTGIPLGKTIGDPNTPAISGSNLANALKTHGVDPMYGTPNLHPDTQSDLASIINEQRAATQWQNVPGASTGDNDAATSLALGALKAKTGVVGSVLSKLLPGSKKADALAQLLRNPNKLGQAMQDAGAGPSTMAQLLRQGTYQGGTDLLSQPSATYGAGMAGQQPQGAQNAP